MNITPLQPADHPRWTELWRAYLDFYETTLPQHIYDATWSRLIHNDGLHALAARDGNAEIQGITHYLFHPHAWTTHPACYLQDLYVDAPARGQGAARALIEAVAAAARTHGADRLYWQTQSNNATARHLYDHLARHNGFICYDYPLHPK